MNPKITNIIINNKQLDKTYFYIINDIMPKTALDIGMFLKRNGSVSRASGGLSMKASIILDGVDIMPNLNVGIYKTIYDHIISIDDFINAVCSGCFEKQYDLIIAFDFCKFIDEEQAKKIIKYLMKNSKTILFDKSSSKKYADCFNASGFEKIIYGNAVLYHMI